MRYGAGQPAAAEAEDPTGGTSRLYRCGLCPATRNDWLEGQLGNEEIQGRDRSVSRMHFLHSVHRNGSQGQRKSHCGP